MSIKDWPGGIVTKNQVVPAGPYSDGAASGIWTMDQAANYTKQGIWPTAGNILGVSDVFSTHLYDGTGNARTITNDIDLAGDGGLVWIQERNDGTNSFSQLFDTERGVNRALTTSSSNQQSTETQTLMTFNSDGFNLGTDGGVNGSTFDYVAWTFRKSSKFFDIVTYDGNSTMGRTISHNLGSVPGLVIIKTTSKSDAWYVLHKDSNMLVLEQTTAEYSEATTADYFGDGTNIVRPTSASFTVGQDAGVNGTGESYVVYLFGNQTTSTGMIQCGSYTGVGSGAVDVNLGFQPEWVLTKNISRSADWMLQDTMRGMGLNSWHPVAVNKSEGELSTTENRVVPTATGFTINNNGGNDMGQAGDTVVYMALRSPMMIAPTVGTQVFYPSLVTATQANQTKTGVGFPADTIINLVRSNANYGQQITSRLAGINKQMFTSSGSAESTTNGTALTSLNQDGYSLGSDSAGTGWNAYSGYTSCKLNFRRAASFFDTVCYSGSGSNTTQAHSLGVAPEMIWVKCRSSAGRDWQVYTSGLGATKYLRLNTTEAEATSASRWNNTAPTSTVFSLGSIDTVNGSGDTYISHLFASLDGVSKIGTFTGTGSDLNVDCGFTAGARFILIKRTDTTGDWYAWDSARGITAGNDPYLLLNSNAAEVTGTDYVDSLNAGFTVTSSAPAGLNASGGTYIFYAIA